MKAYYDRQLANIESIVLKSIGVDYQATKLFAKVLPALHFIWTGFEISTNSYRSRLDEYGGTEQGNLFAGEGYKVKSCLIIYEIEESNQRVIIKALILGRNINCTAIVFMDDTSFYANGINY